MSDLKSPWTNPVTSAADVGLTGDTITARGTDPMVDLGGENGLTPIWSPPVPVLRGEETENSVSGMPQQPARYEPQAEPPPIPKLNERRLTIDERAGARGPSSD